MSSWVVALALALAAAGALWLRWERRAAAQRRSLRALFALSEEMFQAAGPAEMAKRLQASLSRVAGATRVTLYLHNAPLATLDPAPGEGGAYAEPAAVNAPIDSPGGAVAACFRNKALMPITGGGGAGIESTVLLAPMLAGGEALGVLAIEGRLRPTPDQQGAMQHLANQAAAALKLHEQQFIREKLFRSEKLAAAGQLISGVAGELRAPLAAIDAQCRAGLRRGGAAAGDFQVALEHCAEASRLVERLVAFADPRGARPETVELNGLLRALLDLRQQQWRVRGIQCEFSEAPGSLPVAGAASQLEQAFLSLLMNAEQAILQSQDRAIQIATSVLGKRAVTRLRYPAGGTDDRESLRVVDGIVLAHGGEMRAVSSGPLHGYEVFLPLAEEDLPDATAAPAAARPLTAVVADPDPVACRELIRLLGDRRHRAVPAANAEEALDLMERMRFDVAFCSVRQPGANWIEMRERSRGRAGAFVLLTEGIDREMTGAGHLLQKPVSSNALDMLLQRIASAPA